ncbi:hypothetical protein L6452_23194 [Arctium lappa]|uniref:Uncharacterized protein n=1 Tax=Arctium lappa TaxID=4217 RepID=A0ACB9B177_ARCLA|nr:hypothetical protein L6452_23194 [Arctium lappa]
MKQPDINPTSPSLNRSLSCLPLLNRSQLSHLSRLNRSLSRLNRSLVSSSPRNNQSRIENEYGALDKKFGAAGHMAVGLRTGVPWIMCKQDDAPDPIVSRVKTPAMAVLCMACSQVRSTLNLEVAYSYNILSDPEKRRQYDNAGFEAIDADGTDMEIDLSHRRSKVDHFGNW